MAADFAGARRRGRRRLCGACPIRWIGIDASDEKHPRGAREWEEDLLESRRALAMLDPA
jgi:hypothetical protein